MGKENYIINLTFISDAYLLRAKSWLPTLDSPSRCLLHTLSSMISTFGDIRKIEHKYHVKI